MDTENRSYIDENSREMVLDCGKYPTAPAKPELVESFVIHSRRWAIALRLFIGLFVLPIAIMGGIGSQEYLTGAVLAIICVSLIFHGIYLIAWKCWVECDTIYYRSLFRRKTIAFSDIKRVVAVHSTRFSRYSGTTTPFVGIALRSETGNLFRVYKSKVGYRTFIARLQEYDIPGVEDILWR